MTAATTAPRRRVQPRAEAVAAVAASTGSRFDRGRAAVAVAVVFVGLVVAAFGLATFHSMLAEGQFELDHLNAEIADRQREVLELRSEVAELRSPAYIRSFAHDYLGMVEAEDTLFLPTDPSVVESVVEAGARGGSSDPPEGDLGQWQEIKPQLQTR